MLELLNIEPFDVVVAILVFLVKLFISRLIKSIAEKIKARFRFRIGLDIDININDHGPPDSRPKMLN